MKIYIFVIVSILLSTSIPATSVPAPQSVIPQCISLNEVKIFGVTGNWVTQLPLVYHGQLGMHLNIPLGSSSRSGPFGLYVFFQCYAAPTNIGELVNCGQDIIFDSNTTCAGVAIGPWEDGQEAVHYTGGANGQALNAIGIENRWLTWDSEDKSVKATIQQSLEKPSNCDECYVSLPDGKFVAKQDVVTVAISIMSDYTMEKLQIY